MPDKLPKDKVWKTVHAYQSKDMTRILRESLDELGYEYVRDRTERHYTRFAVVIPMPQFAYVFRFVVLEPEKFVVDVYDTKPNHSGTLHHIEVTGYTKKTSKSVRKLLKTAVKRMDRKPYAITWLDRFTYGFIAPEFMSAKKRWNEMGVR